MLSTFKIDVPPEAGYLLNVLDYHVGSAYLVGGCVRDALLGKTPHDWDICTSAKPNEVLALMAEHDVKTIETGLQHGTVTAHLNGENYEITTFRIDGEYSDNRRPDSITFVDDIGKDLSRRDFTINAIAYNEQYGCGNLVDPWGGYTDLCNGIIRCVGNPDERFQEDGLRILRALRFASTYGFTIERETADAIHRNSDLLKSISAERIQSELCKMLCGEGVLDILLEYKDVMEVIIPELKPCVGFNQRNKFHKYDVYDHIAHAVDGYRDNDISIKMALLLHDIGKPECFTVDAMNDGHFYGHGVNSRDIAETVLYRLRFDNKTANEVRDLVLYHDADIQPNFRSVRRWLNKVGPEMLEKLMIVRECDILAQSDVNRISRIDKIYMIREVAREVMQNQQCFQIKDLAINGRDILSLGVEAGPKVDEILDHLLNKVIEEELENDRDALIEKAKRYLKGV